MDDYSERIAIINLLLSQGEHLSKKALTEAKSTIHSLQTDIAELNSMASGPVLDKPSESNLTLLKNSSSQD